jgi:hypothetical protein
MPEISGLTITNVWRRAITLASRSPRKEITNLIVNVENLDERHELHHNATLHSLNAAMLANGNHAVYTVANTIFPRSLWHPRLSRDAFYERYFRLWPRISSHRENRRGTYFQRLVSFPGSRGPFNQLEHVISAYNSKIRRRSTLQCGILAPDLDLRPTPYQGFPCMQQVAFMPEQNGGLRVTALYPMQYLWARAYGNYTGLIDLGRFMASQMGLTLRAMTCISLAAKLEEPSIAKDFLLGADHEVQRLSNACD